MNERLLVFDCHEAWAYQLQALPQAMDVVIGLRGRQTDGWDESIRPVPRNGRLVRLDEVLRSKQQYHCIIANNLTDLLDAKSLSGPRLLVVHETLDGALREQGSEIPAYEFRNAISKYVRMIGTHVVAVSKLKGRSWGFEDDIVPFSADPAAYPTWSGDLARGLRVANHIQRRPRILMWDFHQQSFGNLPITLVGKNPDLPGVQPSANWDGLKETFRRHRFYIHTADPALEDGYNMATLEAMAAGLPVIGNLHPTSPVEHGVSGFLSDDPTELRGYAQILLADRELAGRLGEAARKSVGERFSTLRFRDDFSSSIESARRKWQAHMPMATHQVSHSSF